MRSTSVDVVVLGAGAAGLMCAIEAGKRGRSVAVIDHAKAPGEKIRISGGGRCNFTNIHCSHKNFLSQNPHFARSALARYTQHDFINLVNRHGIAWHEKTLGQLFCDNSTKDIITMLTGELAKAGGALHLQTTIDRVARDGDQFIVETSGGPYTAQSVVVATGGKSIPKMGATSLGYQLAAQFGLRVTDVRPALVPFTWPSDQIDDWKELSGVSLDARVSHGKTVFDEAILMTHRGMSGPAMLQISSYWRDGDTVTIDMAPGDDIAEWLKQARADMPRAALTTALANRFPKRLAQQLAQSLPTSTTMADISNADIAQVADHIHRFTFRPGGTEGYRTAEVTL
ncbi:MAG: aminoacetone oxidase family FAD-binding enzyme, partial [Ahrensia sp.]